MENPKSDDGVGLMDFARLQLRNTINEAREAIWNLRQRENDTGHLGDNLAGMTRQISEEFHLPISWSISGAPFAVNPPVAHDLLMVAREAVYNSVLHGHPAQIDVSLAYRTRELILSLQDDGCGFDPRSTESMNGRHFGVKGMKERIERSGGKFRLTSAIGKGVHIEVRVPRNR